MSSLAESSRLAPVVITPSNPYKTGDETLIWTITKSGDNYTISQGENYLSWESGNSATTSTTPYELVITKNKSEGTYQIASAATPPVFWRKTIKQLSVLDSIPAVRQKI